MKKWVLLFLLLSVTLPSWAASGEHIPRTCPIFFKGHSLGKNTNQDFKTVLEFVNLTVNKIDTQNLSLTTPVLPANTIGYLLTGIEWEESKTCVIGYWKKPKGKDTELYPLAIQNVEMVKLNDKQGKANNFIKVYFYIPNASKLYPVENVPFWKLWRPNEPVQLFVSVVKLEDGKVTPIIGNAINTKISHHTVCYAWAILFAMAIYGIFYLASRTGRYTDVNSETSSVFRLLTPWRFLESGGGAALANLQVLVFTIIVVSLLFYQWLRTGVLQNISIDLLVLIGISSGGATLAQVSTRVKRGLEDNVYQYMVQRGWFSSPMALPSPPQSLGQILLTDNRFDIHKFQMAVFTIVVAAYVITSGAGELGDVSISQTMLSLLGVSQGFYVTAKASADEIGPFQDGVLSLQKMEETYEKAVPALRLGIQKRYQATATQVAETFLGLYHRKATPDLLQIPEYLTIQGSQTATDPDKAVNPSTEATVSVEANLPVKEALDSGPEKQKPTIPSPEMAQDGTSAVPPIPSSAV